MGHVPLRRPSISENTKIVSDPSADFNRNAILSPSRLWSTTVIPEGIAMVPFETVICEVPDAL